MTALDAIVLVLVLGGAVRGAMRGFTFEVLTLASWLLVIVALRLFHAPFTDALMGVTGGWGSAAVIAFALIFAAFFWGSRLLARRLGIGVRQSVIGPFDRVLGVGFGALKGLIVSTLLFLLANLAIDIGYGGGADRPAWMAESRSFPLLDASGRAIVDFVERRQRASEPDAAVETG